jgi:hypothetical protein
MLSEHTYEKLTQSKFSGEFARATEEPYTLKFRQGAKSALTGLPFGHE